jgi:hypothetical protein
LIVGMTLFLLLRFVMADEADDLLVAEAEEHKHGTRRGGDFGVKRGPCDRVAQG